MITPDEILKHMNIGPEEATKLASEINLLAGQYDIDNNQIIDMLTKNPDELAKHESQVETARQQIKLDLRKMILPEK